jgi:hypothetical protein
MYKKRKTHEIVHNAEETFAQQFFNFIRKSPQYVVQMAILEINLDLGATVQPFALSSASSAHNKDKDKYLVDDIKDPTPRTIEVVEATVVPSHKLHDQPIPVECAVVKVTTAREGEGIEKLVDAKGTFILWPHKDIIVKTHSLPIVSPRSTEVGGTSN